MSDFLAQSSFFGMGISLVVFVMFQVVKEHFKIKNPFFNPLLLSSAFIIIFVLLTNIDYEWFDQSASHATYWLTPMTICLAIPLYRRIKELKENIVAILISITAGCIGHVMIVVVMSMAVKLNEALMYSVTAKSVTTAIALALCEKLGGIQSVTVVGVTVAGLTGAVLGPSILKLVHVTEPVAQGLAIGCASHAAGTSKAVELGEIQGAMSSLAIVVTGILTVIIVPIVVGVIG